MASIYTQILRSMGVSENWLRSSAIAPVTIKRVIAKKLENPIFLDSRTCVCRGCKEIYFLRWMVSKWCAELSVVNRYEVPAGEFERFEQQGYCSNTCWREGPEYKNQLREWQEQGERIAKRIKETTNAQAKGNDFYSSREWLDLRYATLLKYGHRCQCCGSSPWHGKVMHVDHIRPRHTYPDLALSPDNLQVLCEECNLGKGARHGGDWRR